MKILQVITSLRIGGAEALVVNLIERLQNIGNEVDICIFDGQETPLLEKLRINCPHTKIYILGKGVYNPLYIAKLIKLMRHYDVVHTHNSSPQLFVAIANIFSSVHLVSTEHNTSNRKRNWKWYAPIESWMYRQYDHIICISKIAENKLRNYMGGDWLVKGTKQYNKISTINNGVDVERIHNAPPDEKLLSLKGKKTAILMVAGFRDAKDQDTIVRALPLLDKEKFEVWFAGVGVRQPIVEDLASSLNVGSRVRFLGLRTDIPNVLKAADIIIMSSHWEGLSLSNVEGMSAGKPFIASDVNGLREVTKGWGLLFPHHDYKSLADKILTLSCDKQISKETAESCYERAKQFDISTMVEAYYAVYIQLMKDGRAEN